MSKKFIFSLLAGLVYCGSAMSQAAYDPAKCAQVAGTLNISWVEIAPTPNGCVGIEFTNGTQQMAQSGRLQMAGTSTSVGCLANDTYDLTLSADRASLVGTFASLPTPVTFTRVPGRACFTGHWADGNTDFVGYLSADFFTLATPTKQVAVPTLQQWSLVLLAAMLSGVAFWRQRRES